MPAAQDSQLIERIKQISEQAVGGASGIEVADVQLRGAGKARLLRLYIDKAGGVTHGDCELVSERVGQMLDEQDVMPEEGYTLEVSSLGADRKLIAARDFERVVGQKVGITLRAPLEGQTRVEGKLLAVSGDRLELETKPGRSLAVRLEQVGKAKLKFEP